MAERVKRRVAAARLAVAFVAAGTIAGATAWAQAGPPPTARSSASDIFAKIKIDSSNVIDGSLLYRDFKKSEVPSFRMFSNLNTAFFKYQKADKRQMSTINGEINDANVQIGDIKNELGGYMKVSDADARYYNKATPVVMGDGSVFTGDGLVGNQLIGLLNVPNLIKVEGVAQKVRFTNTSDVDVLHTATDCADPQGLPTPAGTLKPGEFLECDARGDAAQTMQFSWGARGVATINFSSISVPGGAQDTVQILVGL